MEAATVAEKAEGNGYDGRAEATRTVAELFEWSTFVDVGKGAEGCEHKRDGQCEDPDHFHCWLCLPNLYQARDIRDKALAAKARKRRALTQDGGDGSEPSDAHLVLEQQLQGWAAHDASYEALLERMAKRNAAEHYQEIMEELLTLEQFENRGQDLEEYRRQLALAEDERDSEEWERLQKDMDDYSKAFEERREEREERELAALRNEPKERVIEMERQFQLDNLGDETFMHIFYTWTYYVCARVPSLTGHSTERVFKSPEQLREAPPEVLDALREDYSRLETRTRRRGDAAGN